MDLKVPPELKESQWFNCLATREQELILCLLPDAANTFPTTLDTSQQIARVAKGYESILPTLTPGGKTWLYSRNRFLIGREYLSLQGFPVQWLPESLENLVTDLQLKDLAGNAFSGTVFGCVYISVLAHLPKRSRSQEVFDHKKLAQLLMAADLL